MKISLAIFLLFGSGLYAAGTAATQTRQAAPRQAQPAVQTQASPAPAVTSSPNAKSSFGSSSSRRSVTLGQIERQTGGKVIGAVPVTVEGRQLNQIKVRMPNGRIVIDRRLFDDKGRSVDTVNVNDVDSDPRD